MAATLTKVSLVADSSVHHDPSEQAQWKDRYSPLKPSPVDRKSPISPEDRISHPTPLRVSKSSSCSIPETETEFDHSISDEMGAIRPFVSASIPYPERGSQINSTTSTNRGPDFPFKEYLVPCESRKSGHVIWGIEPTPFFEPDLKVLKKNDLANRNSLARLQEITDLLEERKGGLSEKTENEYFQEIYRRSMAVVMEDIPNIQRLPPAEQMSAFLNLYLLYKTSYQITTDNKRYPAYPTWMELAKAQQPRRKWIIIAVSVVVIFLSVLFDAVSVPKFSCRLL